MANYCGKCGAKVNNNAKVCGRCGAPIKGVSSTSPGKEDFGSKAAIKAKKSVALAIALVALVIIVALAATIVSSFIGCKGLLRKTMAAYENYDIDTLVSLSSDVYYYGDGDWVEDYFENSIGADLDFFESLAGHKYKFSYKVNELYDASNRKEHELISGIENTYPDFDVALIEKIVIANLTVTAKQGRESASIDIEVTMTKENGTWRILYID